MEPPITHIFGRDYLQNRIVQEFALAKHMGIRVESADDAAVVLRAPLTLNANYKGTAFGGSLYSVAVLAGWAWVTRHLAVQGFYIPWRVNCAPRPWHPPLRTSINSAKCCNGQAADEFACAWR
jgi:hypothetical protein